MNYGGHRGRRTRQSHGRPPQLGEHHFVMEQKRARRLQENFAYELVGKPLVCLHILDDYQLMQSELTALMESAVTPHLASDA